MLEAGLEPARPFGHQILSLARLPVSPLQRVVYQLVLGAGFEPARPSGHRSLRPARLPVPPSEHCGWEENRTPDLRLFKPALFRPELPNLAHRHVCRCGRDRTFGLARIRSALLPTELHIGLGDRPGSNRHGPYGPPESQSGAASQYLPRTPCCVLVPPARLERAISQFVAGGLIQFGHGGMWNAGTDSNRRHNRFAGDSLWPLGHRRRALWISGKSRYRTCQAKVWNLGTAPCGLSVAPRQRIELCLSG